MNDDENVDYGDVSWETQQILEAEFFARQRALRHGVVNGLILTGAFVAWVGAVTLAVWLVLR